jgi:hypothetical protein
MITVEGGSVREGYGTTPPKDKKLGACPERSRRVRHPRSAKPGHRPGSQGPLLDLRRGHSVPIRESVDKNGKRFPIFVLACRSFVLQLA